MVLRTRCLMCNRTAGAQDWTERSKNNKGIIKILMSPDEHAFHALSLHKVSSTLRATVCNSMSHSTSSSCFQVTAFPFSIHVSMTTNNLDSASPGSCRMHFTLSPSPKPTPILSQLPAILGRNSSIFCVETSVTAWSDGHMEETKNVYLFARIEAGPCL